MVLYIFSDNKVGRNLLPDMVMHIPMNNREEHSLRHTNKIARFANSVYVTIAGNRVNKGLISLKNFQLNGQVSTSNPLLHIHANRCASLNPTNTQ